VLSYDIKMKIGRLKTYPEDEVKENKPRLGAFVGVVTDDCHL